MNAEIESKGPSLEDSLINLVKALEIVSDRSKKYYRKDAPEVSKETLKKVDTSFILVTNLIQKFAFSWSDSRRSGPDAIEVSKKLDERIDIKLLRTGKLDFEQLKKMMTRLNRADDALLGLNRINFYISYYRKLCAEKELKRIKEHADLFIDGVLNPIIDNINSEIERFRNQIERCNLYYQSKLQSKTFKIAFISLLISVVAVLLSILSNVLT